MTSWPISLCGVPETDTLGFMAIDLDALPANVRLKQIHIGRRFGSASTLAQANQTLDAHAKYAADVAADGFMAADADRLTEARDGLTAAGVGREGAKARKKTDSKGYVAAMNAGQTERLSARSILMAVHDDFEEAGHGAAASTISTALQATRASPNDAEPMAVQLDLLRGLLEDATIKTRGDSRGGAAAAGRLQEGAIRLRKADQGAAGRGGTPAETQTLDQLDGIIVGLVRKAQKAGTAAGKRLGNPALGKAFRLDKLYAARGGTGEDGRGGGGGGGGG